jgi:methylmalonyl-CoA mutase
LPKFQDWGDLGSLERSGKRSRCVSLHFGNLSFQKNGEDPPECLQEGGPERTNRRFHYVSAEMPAKRLSTAFDSVTYGQDPFPPDIYGKIGNAEFLSRL